MPKRVAISKHLPEQLQVKFSAHSIADDLALVNVMDYIGVSSIGLHWWVIRDPRSLVTTD